MVWSVSVSWDSHGSHCYCRCMQNEAVGLGKSVSWDMKIKCADNTILECLGVKDEGQEHTFMWVFLKPIYGHPFYLAGWETISLWNLCINSQVSPKAGELLSKNIWWSVTIWCLQLKCHRFYRNIFCILFDIKNSIYFVFLEWCGIYACVDVYGTCTHPHRMWLSTGVDLHLWQASIG